LYKFDRRACKKCSKSTIVIIASPKFIHNGIIFCNVIYTYKFNFNFAERTTWQLQYNAAGRLVYQLPSQLVIQNAVLQTPIHGPAPNNAIIGWYAINTDGLVQVWFDNVRLDGNPTPGNVNFIDYYGNVTAATISNRRVNSRPGQPKLQPWIR